LAAMRAGADPSSLSELSYKASQELEMNPILQSDKELRMFCLIVKGELDGEVSSAAMRQDWSEVSELAQELGNAKWQYRAQGQLGFADFYDGDLSGAQKNVAQALLGATAIKDVGGQIFYLSATAQGLVSQAMNDEGIQYADRAIALAESTPDAGYPIIAEKARLIALVNTGKADIAKTELKKALARAEAEKSYGQMADLNQTASQIARLQNDIPGAVVYLTEALHDAILVDARKVIPAYQSDLSDLYRVTGNLPKAEALANEAATSVQRFGFIPLMPRFLNVLAGIQIDEQKYHEADETLDKAAAIQDMMIGNAESPLGKTALVKGAGDLYAKHFALIAEHTHDLPKAFSVVEQARGRVMRDLLVSGATASRDSVVTENKIAELRLKLMAADSNQAIQQLRDSIFLLEQSRSINPEISIVRTGEHEEVSLARVQSNLSDSEALLEYVMDDPASYCLVVTHSSYKVVTLAGASTIAPAVSRYLREVRAKRPGRNEATDLYRLLLERIPEASTRKQLVIIRDGQLHLIPFDALSNRTGHYVIESQSVVYSPSATSFFLLRTAGRRARVNPGVLAVGGVPYGQSGLKQSVITRGLGEAGLSDLPNSEEEARVAVESLPSRFNRLLIGTEATEAAFKKASNHRVVHLAVHAVVNETRPGDAALVFLSDPRNGEDGFLGPSEIVQRPLNADVVILSACDTAVGPVEGEEGISTIFRAFLLAGTRTVVSTLWSIDDNSTLYLMKHFYAELARKKSVPHALRVSKLKMLSTFGRTRALPYFWAGFTVEGFATPPVEQ